MIRWGILGCGDVTEVKSGPALRNVARSSVVACMRRDPDKAEDYAARHKIARAYSDADELITDKDVNAIYIATPPASHADLTIRALRARKPVLVEKPIALSVEDADAMIAMSQKNDVPLMVAYYRRALPRFEKLREIVQGGQIGELRCVQVQHFKRSKDKPVRDWRLDPKIGGGGHFVDMQTHVLDWLDYVFGPARSVDGIARGQSDASVAEDIVSYTLGFESVVANGLCAYSTHQDSERVTVHGSTGSVSTSFFAPAPIILTQNGVRTVLDIRDPAHAHQPFVQRAIAHLLDGAENPASAESARRTTAVVQKILN